MRIKFFKLTLSQNIVRACERLNCKYVNSLKRTGKLLKAQMLPGPGVFLQSSGSIWTALTEKGVAESSAQW